MSYILVADRTADADVVWPALYVASGSFAWYVIVVGLLLEYPFAKFITGASWRSAWEPTVVMNLASTLAGAVFIPIAGIAWEVFPGSLIHEVTHTGTFNPYTWIATFVMAVVINSGIEALVLKRLFQAPRLLAAFAWLLPANACSVALAFFAIRAQLIGFAW
ncbi:MAG: hypothetical protein R3F56_24050 [Planctomycetota bacterium]